jgi:hypothetical protein
MSFKDRLSVLPPALLGAVAKWLDQKEMGAMCLICRSVRSGVLENVEAVTLGTSGDPKALSRLLRSMPHVRCLGAADARDPPSAKYPSVGLKWRYRESGTFLPPASDAESAGFAFISQVERFDATCLFSPASGLLWAERARRLACLTVFATEGMPALALVPTLKKLVLLRITEDFCSEAMAAVGACSGLESLCMDFDGTTPIPAVLVSASHVEMRFSTCDDARNVLPVMDMPWCTSFASASNVWHPSEKREMTVGVMPKLERMSCLLCASGRMYSAFEHLRAAKIIVTAAEISRISLPASLEDLDVFLTNVSKDDDEEMNIDGILGHPGIRSLNIQVDPLFVQMIAFDARIFCEMASLKHLGVGGNVIAYRSSLVTFRERSAAELRYKGLLIMD